MSNADELLHDARKAMQMWELADPYSREEHEAAVAATGLWSALDDHMSGGGAPPADWAHLAHTPVDGPAVRKLRETDLAHVTALDAWWLLTELKRELA